MLKRFLLFECETYYPSGGWENFVSSHDTLEEAVKAKTPAMCGYGFWHVVDLTTAKIVDKGDS